MSSPNPTASFECFSRTLGLLKLLATPRARAESSGGRPVALNRRCGVSCSGRDPHAARPHGRRVRRAGVVSREAAIIQRLRPHAFRRTHGVQILLPPRRAGSPRRPGETGSPQLNVELPKSHNHYTKASSNGADAEGPRFSTEPLPLGRYTYQWPELARPNEVREAECAGVPTREPGLWMSPEELDGLAVEGPGEGAAKTEATFIPPSTCASVASVITTSCWRRGLQRRAQPPGATSLTANPHVGRGCPRSYADALSFRRSSQLRLSMIASVRLGSSVGMSSSPSLRLQTRSRRSCSASW